MECIIANTSLDLCRGGLQEFWEIERLKVALVEDEIAYHKSIGDIGHSTSISDPSMSIPSSFTSWGDIGFPHTYTNVIDSSLNWIGWG
jgi:hypothetical protein